MNLKVNVYRYRDTTAAQLFDGDEFSLDHGDTWRVCAYNHSNTGTVAIYVDPDAPRGSGGPIHAERIALDTNTPVRVKTYQVDIPGKVDRIVRNCAWPHDEPLQWRIYLLNGERIDRGAGHTWRVIAPASLWRALVEYLDDVNWEYDGAQLTRDDRADRRAVRTALDRITTAVPGTAELARSTHGTA